MYGLNLICEEWIDPSVSSLTLIEGAGNDKDLYLEGIYLQGNKKNRNGRNYGTPMLSGSVSKFVESRIKTKRAMGELNHPQGVEINLDRVSHLITDLRMEGDDGIGKSKLLSTPCGEIAKSLYRGGVQLGVSTRGLGKLGEDTGNGKDVSDFELITVDIVADPSAPDAFVQGVMEGVEYYLDCKGGVCKMSDVPVNVDKVAEAFDIAKKDLSNLPVSGSVDYSYKSIMKMLNSL
jgi:hypothetical protein